MLTVAYGQDKIAKVDMADYVGCDAARDQDETVARPTGLGQEGAYG